MSASNQNTTAFHAPSFATGTRRGSPRPTTPRRSRALFRPGGASARGGSVRSALRVVERVVVRRVFCRAFCCRLRAQSRLQVQLKHLERVRQHDVRLASRVEARGLRVPPVGVHPPPVQLVRPLVAQRSAPGTRTFSIAWGPPARRGTRFLRARPRRWSQQAHAQPAGSARQSTSTTSPSMPRASATGSTAPIGLSSTVTAGLDQPAQLRSRWRQTPRAARKENGPRSTESVCAGARGAAAHSVQGGWDRRRRGKRRDAFAQ